MASLSRAYRCKELQRYGNSQGPRSSHTRTGEDTEEMYHATTPLDPTYFPPLRRSAIGYRFRHGPRGRAGMRAAASAALLITTLAVVFTFVI